MLGLQVLSKEQRAVPVLFTWWMFIGHPPQPRAVWGMGDAALSREVGIPALENLTKHAIDTGLAGDK